MKFMKTIMLGVFLVTAGCQTAGQAVQQVTTSTPVQVTTLGQAAQAMDIVVVATDKYVNSGQANRATLVKLQQLRGDVRKAMDDLNAANMAHQSLVFAAFNTAYAAFINYKNQQGIPS